MNTKNKMNKYSEEMKHDWNDRAQDNSFYFVKSDKKDWDIDEYFESGQRDMIQSLYELLYRLSYKTQDKTLLEIGCGNGRMTYSFSKMFLQVYAIDVSKIMVEEARKIIPSKDNIIFYVTNGIDLKSIENQSVDFCYSYTVFQHIPDSEIVFGLLEEIFRVLRPMGILKFQFNSYWKTQLERTVMKYSSRLLSIFGISTVRSKFMGYFNTWIGCYIPRRKMIKVLKQIGFNEVTILDYGRTDTWVECIKP